MSTRSNSRFPKRSVRSKPRQTRLQFSPLPSSSPAKETYSPAVQGRLASVRYRGAKINHAADELSNSVEEQSLPTPEASSQVQYKDVEEAQVSPGEAAVPTILLEDLDEDEDDLISPAQKRRRISDGSPISATPSTSIRRSTRLHPGSSHPLPSAEDFDGQGTPHSSSPLTRRSSRLQRTKPSRPTRSTRSSSVQTLASVDISILPHPPSSKLSDLGAAETSDDDDNIMASRPTARRRQSRTVKDPFIVNDDELQYISDDGPPKRRTAKNRKNQGADFVVDDENIEYITSDEEDTDLLQARKSERSAKKARKSRQRTREEQDELDDDLQNLQDSDEEPSATKTRTRGGPVTTKRDQAKEHLELLKRRRAGERVTRVYDSDDESEVLSGVDLALIGHPDYDEEGSVHSATESDIGEEQIQTQDNEDDFVVEDTTERLGRPHSDLPLQFTSFASAKPRELFIHIIEWLVKNKIAPAFSREDELYNLSFARIDDQVKAQAGSRLISAAWGNEFKHAILARPEMKVSTLPGTDEDNLRICDACNRVNHPARYEFVFSGQPYFKKTLEPVDDSDDENDDADDVSRDEEGHALPSQHQRFYLGRYCAANAEMGHKLTHWKHHLNDELFAYLEEQGVLSAESIIAREKMNKKKREREAENIVDSMQETGMIAEFWANFENNLDDARLGMEDFEKKGGRTKGRIGAVRATANGTTREWSNDRYRVTQAPASDSEGD